MCRFDDDYIDSLLKMMISDYLTSNDDNLVQTDQKNSNKIHTLVELFKEPENRLLLENYLTKVDDVSKQYRELTQNFHHKIRTILEENISDSSQKDNNKTSLN